MSDAYDHYLSHAVVATRKARQMPHGPIRDKQRTVARVYHLLAKEAAFASNVQYIGDFRAARKAESLISRSN